MTHKPKRLFRKRAVVASAVGVVIVAAFAVGSSAASKSSPIPSVLVEQPPPTIPDGREIPQEVIFEEPFTAWPKASVDLDAIEIGDSVDSKEPPPGIQTDGSYSVDLVPDLVPVSIDGKVVGFVASDDLNGESPPPPIPDPDLDPATVKANGEVQIVDSTPMLIVDRIGNVIGEFNDDGFPYIYENSKS